MARAKEYIIKAKVNDSKHALYGEKCTLKSIENGFYYVKVKGFKSLYKFKSYELEEVK